MKNVTITLEEDVAKWARVWAANHDSSVSKLLGNVLKSKMIQEQGYQLAMQQYLNAPTKALKDATQSYPGRANLYDR